MAPVQVTVVNSKDIWEAIATHPIWQVVIILLTSFATAYFTNHFLTRRNNNTKRLEAISDFKRYGYELQQALSERMQSEIFCDFYSSMHTLTKDDDYLEQHKIQVANMPKLSLGVSAAYGQVYKSASLIQQLTTKSQKTHMLDEVLEYRTPVIHRVKNDATVDDVLKHKDACTRELTIWIHKNIKKKVDAAYAQLISKPSSSQRLHNILFRKSSS